MSDNDKNATYEKRLRIRFDCKEDKRIIIRKIPYERPVSLTPTTLSSESPPQKYFEHIDEKTEEEAETPLTESILSTEMEEKITAKFSIRDKQTIARSYPLNRTIAEVKSDLANRFDVDAKLLVIRQDDTEIDGDFPLANTLSNDFGIHDFDLELRIDETAIKDPKYKPPQLDMDVYLSKYHMPDFLMVNVTKKGPCGICTAPQVEFRTKPIVVEIENKAIVKPFLCGYRDKITGTEYLNAFSQTGPSYKHWKTCPRYSRDTQTWEPKDNVIDTPHEQTTQCYLDGNNVHYFSEPGDYYITPTKYQTYAQKMRKENKLEKIIIIQRNWRRVLLKRGVKRCAKEFRRLVANRIEEEKRFEEQTRKNIEQEERRKLLPHTQVDFDLLYSDIEKWKMAEMKRIAERFEGPARITEINILLDKEIQLRNAVERQRTITVEALRDFREEKLLTKLGAPLNWIGYKDNTIHMDLLRTQRVRFLHEVYKDLKKPRDKLERLKFLNEIDEILKNEQDFPECLELIDLIDRERNLLAFCKYCDVEILRKRQNMLFMELIKFTKEPKPSKEPKRMCEVCKKVKPLKQFAIFTRQNIVDTCKKCYYLKVSSSDNIHYLAILRAIQREERKFRCSGSFAFIMQVDDIRYLIDKIWHGHSILSKIDDIRHLRLPRWIKSDDWSPWNSVCMTETEARDHYNLQSLDVYNKKLLSEIRNRRLLARNAFHKLASVATEFLETGQWWNVGLNQQRSPEIPKPGDKTFHEMTSR